MKTAPLSDYMRDNFAADHSTPQLAQLQSDDIQRCLRMAIDRLPETEGELRFNGYKVHRFSDRHLVLGTLEYRWWLTNKIYALLAGNVGEVASQASRLRWDDHHESYGLGFRYGYSDRLAARFDIAKGSEAIVLNFTLQDTF